MNTKTTPNTPLATGLYLLGRALTQAETLQSTLKQAHAQLGADKRFRHDMGNIQAQIDALKDAIQDAAAHAEMARDETPTA